MDDYFGFILHYLDNRQKSFGIDAPVREIMSEHGITIVQLEQDDYLVADSSTYILSPKGKETADLYFSTYKEKNKKMFSYVAEMIQSGQYMNAFMIRARRYSEWVIPPGIGAVWTDTELVKEQSQKRMDHLRQIQFDDIDNTSEFKENLFKILLYEEIADNKIITDIFPTPEKLNCPALESFLLKRNAVLSEYHKVYIYLFAKIARNNIESVDRTLGRKTDTTFNEGWNVSDDWVKFAHDLDEYNRLTTLEIPGFPKTFQTYQKHKNNSSEKYKAWMDYISGL